MNSLAKVRLCLRIIALQRARACSSKSESPWYIDQKPGPFPVTEEEKIVAAKKYNMLREEYEPYPDGTYGDYPKLPIQSIEEREVYYPWTDTYRRRMHSEPIHAFDCAYWHSRIYTSRERYSTGFQLLCFLGACGIVGYIFTGTTLMYHHPVGEKQWPIPDVVHYTFDLEGEEKKHHH